MELPKFLIWLLIGWLVVSMLTLMWAQGERDRLASAAVLERARADSLAVAVATHARTATEALEGQREVSERLERVARDLDASRARNATLTRLRAEAEGRAAAVGTIQVDTVELLVEAPEAADRTLAVDFDDPPLTAQVSCRLPTVACTMDWRVALAVDLLHAELPDGSVAVFADVPERHRDRVRVEVDTLVVVPRAPQLPSWWSPRRWWGYGAAFGLGYLAGRSG